MMTESSDRGLTANQKGEHGMIALPPNVPCVEQGFPNEMTSMVQPQTSKSWWTTLCDCVKNEDIGRLEDVLKENPASKNQESIDKDKVLAESPLHLAIINDKEDIVNVLLSHHLDVSVTNLYGETPLHVACRTGNTDIVEKLLQAGASLDDKDCGECTPLFHAIYSSQAGAVDVLIRAGCDLDTLNEELLSPLDHAIFYNQKEIISLLLRGGCAIDKTMGMVYYPGHYSNSILFSLWANSDIENVKVLINSGYHIPYSLLTNLLQVAKLLDWDDCLLKEVADIIREPNSLKSSCRIVIRRQLTEVKKFNQLPIQVLVRKLPLPALLKDYISMFT